jgi:hypothetical protein
VRQKTVNADQLQTPPHVRGGVAYLSFAADRPDPANGANQGAHPDRVDEVDTAQIDDYVNPGSDRIIYGVAKGHSADPVQAARRPTNDARVRTNIGFDHTLLRWDVNTRSRARIVAGAQVVEHLVDQTNDLVTVV